MAYCTLADLKKALPERNLIQVTDDEGSGNLNSARVTAAIEDADDLIDTYLRGKHTVPLSTVPSIIRRLSVTLAIHYLYSRRLEFEVTDSMESKYKEAIRFLEGVRDGKNILSDVDGAANTGGYYKTNKATTDRVFDSTTLDTF